MEELNECIYATGGGRGGADKESKVLIDTGIVSPSPTLCIHVYICVFMRIYVYMYVYI